MDIAEFSQLELQVDYLIQQLSQLQAENCMLRQKLAGSSRQRSLLHEKNRNAVKKINSIINQLKEELP